PYTTLFRSRPDFARLHRRQQRVTASKQRGLRIHGQDLHQHRNTVRLTILQFAADHVATAPLPMASTLRDRSRLAVLIALSTCSGRRDMSRCVTPSGESASRTAFTMAGGVQMLPDSPI